jgi:hypothetical protein
MVSLALTEFMPSLHRWETPRLCIWDSETGVVIAGPFEGHTFDVTSVGFSPDGRRVVSGSDDSTIRIWDIDTVTDLFEGYTDCATPVESSSNTKLIVLNPCDQYAEYPERFNHCHFDTDTGWVKTSDGDGLLFWVPDKHRGRVCGTDTIVIMGQRMTRVDLNSFVHGPHWTQCHHRLSEGTPTSRPPKITPGRGHANTNESQNVGFRVFGSVLLVSAILAVTAFTIHHVHSLPSSSSRRF